jgi:hypothetical protein
MCSSAELQGRCHNSFGPAAYSITTSASLAEGEASFCVGGRRCRAFVSRVTRPPVVARPPQWRLIAVAVPPRKLFRWNTTGAEACR